MQVGGRHERGHRARPAEPVSLGPEYLAVASLAVDLAVGGVAAQGGVQRAAAFEAAEAGLVEDL